MQKDIIGDLPLLCTVKFLRNMRISNEKVTISLKWLFIR